jgi:polygalacturonase
MKLLLTNTFFLLATLPLWAQDGLVGDGVTDDTAAIQAILDAGRNSVYLPPPSKFYLISKPLRLHSNQTLKLDPNTAVRLADNAKQYMLVNDDFENGNENIQVIGGIWDGNNLKQTCDYHDGIKGSVPFDPNRFLGCGMLFLNVNNLRIEKLTIKDTETYAMNLGNVKWFTVKDIVFDFNLKKGNMDGVHLQGGCQFGWISNIKGDTNDDMVALNADDCNMYEITKGPITDIRIDGLYCNNGYTGVRLNSMGHPVKRIHISNVFGSFRYNGISLTHHNVHPGQPTIFEDIVLDNIFVAKQFEAEVKPQPWDEVARRTHAVVWIASNAAADNLCIKNLARREWMENSAPTVLIDKGATVKKLSLDEVTQVNHAVTPLKLVANEGTIEHLFLNKVIVRGAKTDSVTGNGTVQETNGNIVKE